MSQEPTRWRLIEPSQPPPKRHRSLVIALAIICVLLASGAIVYAAITLNGTITVPVGATDATITVIGFRDATLAVDIPLTCSGSKPTWTCTPTDQALVINPGDSYTASFTVHNSGAVTIPTVTASVSVSFNPNGYPLENQGPWSYSTSNLASGADWAQTTGTFTIGAHAIYGGTLTITITVSG